MMMVKMSQIFPSLSGVEPNRLAARFASVRAVPSKTYAAVLEGRMAKSPKSGEVVLKLRADKENRVRQVSTIVYRQDKLFGQN